MIRETGQKLFLVEQASKPRDRLRVFRGKVSVSGAQQMRKRDDELTETSMGQLLS